MDHCPLPSLGGLSWRYCARPVFGRCRSSASKTAPTCHRLYMAWRRPFYRVRDKWVFLICAAVIVQSGIPSAPSLGDAGPYVCTDLVDHVIRNILPAYQPPKVTLTNYAADMDRILKASRTDSAAQRDKLLNALRATTFVVSIDTKTGQRWGVEA